MSCMRSKKSDNLGIYVVLQKITKMKTSISSKAFRSITDRQADKIFTEKILIYEGNLHKQIKAISQLGAEKIMFPLNVVDRRTNGRTFAFIE